MTDKKPLIETEPPKDGDYGKITLMVITDDQRNFIVNMIGRYFFDFSHFYDPEEKFIIWPRSNYFYYRVIEKIRESRVYPTEEVENTNDLESRIMYRLENGDIIPIPGWSRIGIRSDDDALSLSNRYEFKDRLESILKGYAIALGRTLNREVTENNSSSLYFIDGYDFTEKDLASIIDAMEEYKCGDSLMRTIVGKSIRPRIVFEYSDIDDD